jgi:hypothetical protein
VSCLESKPQAPRVGIEFSDVANVAQVDGFGDDGADSQVVLLVADFDTPRPSSRRGPGGT